MTFRVRQGKRIHRFRSRSSKGVVYTVRQLSNGLTWCNCPGFRYVGHCWHTKNYRREPSGKDLREINKELRSVPILQYE